jgi:hypothetical protein|tara:strand:- start:388 stop:882 length:495 start_codon:yes stop_codon:yes gene_type:complete
MTFELIETVEATSTLSEIEFSNIPQDGLDLFVYISAQSDGSQFQFKINNGTYYWHSFLRGSGTAINGLNGGNVNIYIYNTGQSSVGEWANMKMRFSRYADSTQKVLTYDALRGSTKTQNNIPTNSPEFGGLARYDSTDGKAAITSIKFITPLYAGSTMSLYKTY